MNENFNYIIEEKCAMRKKMKTQMTQFLSNFSAEICGKKAFEIFSLSELYKNCKTILLFVSKNPEISTFHFIKSALKDKKKVAVPKCVGKKMQFFYLNENEPLNEQLVLGAFNILEPSEDLKKCEFGDLSKNCVLIVPGLAFEKNGNRLGKGKGFYDCFIAELNDFYSENKKTKIEKVGLCYSIQIQKNVPCQKFDAKMNYILCENEFLKCQN